MSISATSNYMSNDEIVAWMQQKTDALYSNMTSAMQASDSQADCEAALNKIKTDIADSKTNGGDAAAIHDEVNAALAKYGDVPGVKDALQPIADKLNADYGTADPVAVKPGVAETPPVGASSGPSTVPVTEAEWAAVTRGHPWGVIASPGAPYTLTYTTPTSPGPKSVTVTADEVTAWTTSIGDAIDDLGRKDQLALINIQEINSEINQAKQTASALMDSADKSANAIINHIG
jgi:hypothetical protein